MVKLKKSKFVIRGFYTDRPCSSNKKIANVSIDEYYIKNDYAKPQAEALFTYAISTCCGVIAYDKKNMLLMHLASGMNPEEVAELIRKRLSKHCKIILAPGSCCNMEFKNTLYDDIYDCLKKYNYDIENHAFTEPLGFIYADDEKIIFGSDEKVIDSIPVNR